MAKKKLTPVPRPKKAKADPSMPTTASADAAPDLSRIAESLRPLARPLAELAFMVGNAVRHPDQQLAEIRASLRQFGQVEALVVNRRATPPVVIGGNGRLQAMLAEGWTHGAICFVDLDSARANALSRALNRTAEGRTWDKDALDSLLRDLDTGNDPQLDAMLSDLAKEQGLYGSEEPDEPAVAADPEDTQPARITCPECGHEFDGTIRVTEAEDREE